MKQQSAYFANFICKFGDDKVLLDYVEEIVAPAFTDDTLVREFGSTHLFFYESKIVKLEDGGIPVVGIAGTF